LCVSLLKKPRRSLYDGATQKELLKSMAIDPKNMRKLFGLVLLSLLLVGGPVFPQEKEPRTYRLNTQFLKDFGNDFVSVWTGPLEWDGRDWTKLGVVLASTGLIYIVDEDLYDLTKNNRSSSGDDFWKVVSRFGEPLILIGVSGSFYLAGEIAGSTGMRKTALLSVESLLISSTVLYTLKWAVGRARPYTEEGKYTFKPFNSSSDYHSFPSGHTTAAFSVASVIAHLHDSMVVDIVSYSLATLVAFARPFQDKHWPSDVFFGAALGYYVGHKICDRHFGQARKNIDVGLHITPYQQSLSLSFSF